MKTEMVSASGSQQEQVGYCFNRELDAIDVQGGVAGHQNDARVKSESAVSPGV
jgi:hypothetical protein